MSETLETGAPSGATGGDDLDAIIGAAYDEAVASDAPVRDERGRFQSTKSEVEAQEASPEPVEEDTDQPEAKADETAKEPSIDPPQSWSDAEKATWTSLSREAQETILRRERDIEKALADRAAETRDVAPLREVLAPYQTKFATMGLTADQAVRRLLAAQDALERDPDRAFPELMRSFGYDPARLFQQLQAQQAQQQTQQPQEFRDPRVDRLLAEMQQREALSIQAQIEAFEKDPAHPHFKDVRHDMGILMQANPNLTLQQAYDKAIWAVDRVRERILAAERAKAAEADRKARAEQASKAKRAATSVRDSTPGRMAPSQVAADSLDAELERAWAAASAA